jgi:CDP-diacylglycerol--glycerol-3-phosphate 3-phosphatidyltransferase
VAEQKPPPRSLSAHLVASVNLPNALTLVRVLLIPVLVVALTAEGNEAVAAAVFALASATDFLDGWLARRRESVTNFGKVMDPIADKLMVAAALIALVSLERLAAWIALVIVAREFAVSGLRAAAGQQGVVIDASNFGKAKTLVQVATIFVLIIAPDPDAVWVQGLVYATVAVTLASGAEYFLSFRRRMGQAAA